MIEKFRVTYPLITCDAERRFVTREEADAFAAQRREVITASPYMTNRAWQRIKIEEVE
jgi:hypothetical protein